MMWSLLNSGWLMPLVLLTLVVHSVRALWLGTTRRKKGVRVPACEGCKYPVSGHTSLSCPECGRDLRRGGIITPAMEARRRGSTLGAIGGLLFLAIFGTVLGEVLVMSWWIRPATVATGPMTQSTVLVPRSGAYRQIVLDQTADWSVSPMLASAVLTMTTSKGKGSQLKVDGATRAYSTTGTGGNKADHSGPLDAAGLRAWMEAADLDMSDPALAAEADELFRAVDIGLVAPTTAVSALGLGRFTAAVANWRSSGVRIPARRTGMAVSVGNVVLPMVALAVLGLGLVSVAVGIPLIILRRRKLLREHMAANPTPAG